ncbi:hypothetical protein FB565_002574 [Actinoplanes lutulentus]|uniref:Uncharacterized protein n=1 Tax=Actinoplanes lutulentus TaxID=1287878 RepID=A0A327ZEN5_9ACTN|nr:hypothetical protein [Actinoplanes lutulentus]MBB2942861.1 hypothetical protein [Actinoplanes lutulentus]RAK38440.1 hypothetical protein B0I29_105388 [Actinoplanes lutulentus]
MSPHQNLLYIAVAACILLALHMVKRILTPMGALLRVAGAVTVVVLALVTAFALVIVSLAGSL